MFCSKCKNKVKVCESVSCDDEEYSTTTPLTTLNIDETTIPSEVENGNLIAAEFCKSGKFEYLEHESNCSLFYHCENGRAVMKFCDSPLLYNSQHHVCDWSHNVYNVRPLCQQDFTSHTPTSPPYQAPLLQPQEEDEEGSDIVIVEPSRTPPGHCDTDE